MFLYMTRGTNGWKVTANELPYIQQEIQSILRNDPKVIKLFQEGNVNAVNDTLWKAIAKAIGGEYTVVR